VVLAGSSASAGVGVTPAAAAALSDRLRLDGPRPLPASARAARRSVLTTQRYSDWRRLGRAGRRVGLRRGPPAIALEHALALSNGDSGSGA